MATLAVGDVHGQLPDLRDLLNKAKLKAGSDRVIFVGDLVGRGIDSLGVLREVAELGLEKDVVLGNHDFHLLAAHAEVTAQKPDLAGVLEADDADELCAFLRKQPLAVDLPHAGALVVHAGLWHGWDKKTALSLSKEISDAIGGNDYRLALKKLYGSDSSLWKDSLDGGPRQQAIVNYMTRMRVCKTDGSIEFGYGGMPGESSPSGSIPWFDYPGRKTARDFVICGHWSTLGLFVRKDIAMIDTGCCFGGPLTALWVEDRRLIYSR